MNAQTFLELSDFSAGSNGWIARLQEQVAANVIAAGDITLIDAAIAALTAERNYVHGAAVLNDGIVEVAPTATAGAADLPAARNFTRLIINEYEQNILLNFTNPANNNITAYNTTMATNRLATLTALYDLYNGL